MNSFEITKEIISNIRTIRLQKNIPNKEQLMLHVLGGHDSSLDAVIMKMGNLSSLESVTEKDATAATFLVGINEYAVPLGNNIDIEAELLKLNEELKYLQGFKKSVMAKLGNDRFVNNAPVAVVDTEKKKLADAESKIKSIEERISSLAK